MLQQVLTYTIDVMAIVGFICLLTSYINEQLPVTNNQLPTTSGQLITADESPMLEPEAAPIPDPWELPITTNSHRWSIHQPQLIRPVLALCPAAESVKEPVKESTKSPNFKSLNSTTLRQYCTQHGITWRNVRGNGKHMLKETMIAQLEAYFEQITPA